MSSKRKHEFMDKLDSCYKIVLQNSAKGKGISAREIASQLKCHRTTVHSYLNSLELMGKVYSEHGLWYAKETSAQQMPSPAESEIIIELPHPSEQVRNAEAIAELLAKIDPKNYGFLSDFIEARKKSRRVVIRTRNINDPKLVDSIVSQIRDLKNTLLES